MRDILEAMSAWNSPSSCPGGGGAKGWRFALSTVTKTWGSSPRPVGSMMAVREDGLAVGSVSGGCVETAVIETALKTTKTGRAEMLHFGQIDDEKAWDVGLSCGGEINVLVEPSPFLDPDSAIVWGALAERVHRRAPFVLVTRLEDGRSSHALVEPEGSSVGSLSEVSKTLALDAYASRSSVETEIAGARVFAFVHRRPERLIVVGAVHIAVSLIKFAKELGFEVVMIDPRAAFALEERFPVLPDLTLAKWPEKAFTEMEITEDDYAVVLTHDPKIDNQAISLLLKTPAAYIGALGSRTTQAKRREQLLKQGHSEADLARIHGPVGLEIAAKTPEEIGLSIAAEIVKVRRGRK